jgi:AraC family transcriptional regulator
MNQNLNHNNYHAASINFRTVRDLPLAEAEYAANLELPKHSHRHAGFCLILKGGYTESYGKTVLELKPSCVKFQPAGESHTDVYGKENVHCFFVELEPEWLKRMGAEALVGSSPFVYSGSSVAWLMMKLRGEFRAMDDEAPLAIEGIALDLIAETSRNRKRVAVDQQLMWLRQAREFINDEFAQPLTLSAIAESVKVHPVYLANSFRRRYGCSVGEYLRQRRIEFACHRISDSKDSLAEVALAAGFSNQSHFSRTFKRVTGMTPAQFRKGSER